MASIISAPVQFHGRCHLPVKIYYEDTDCVGIVYHSNYLKYFERGRELLLGQDQLVHLFDTSGRSFVVVNVKIAYKKAARHGDTLEVRTVPTIESSYRLEFDQSVWRRNVTKKQLKESNNDAWTLIVQGTVQMVCVQKDMKICALPDMINVDMRQIFGDLLNPQKKMIKRKLPPPKKKLLPGNNGWSDPKDIQIEVYYEDTDFTTVVYYANYMKFMERARSQLFSFKSLEIMKKKYNASFAVYNAELDFKSGGTIGDLLIVKTKFKIESDYRIAFEQDIYKRCSGMDERNETNLNSDTNDVLLVKGKLVLCCINDLGNLIKLPEIVLEITK
jgi:acyl-CoA thioester hydrolase